MQGLCRLLYRVNLVVRQSNDRRKSPKPSSKEDPMTPDVRPLVAGNWKMNGTGESLDELRMIVNRPNSAIGEKIDALICVPGNARVQGSPIRRGRGLEHRRTGLPFQEVRRSYRRYLCGDAEGCRCIACHSRPFGTPDRSWRNRRIGQCQGKGGLGARDSLLSSALARQKRSGRQVPHSTSYPHSLPVRFPMMPMRAIPSLPMNRCGQSERG